MNKLIIASLGLRAAVLAVLIGGFVYMAIGPRQEPTTIKMTYELRGVQTVVVVHERDSGSLGILGAVQLVMLQNDMQLFTSRPISKVVALERCVHGTECHDWMPRKQEDGSWTTSHIGS